MCATVLPSLLLALVASSPGDVPWAGPLDGVELAVLTGPVCTRLLRGSASSYRLGVVTPTDLVFYVERMRFKEEAGAEGPRCRDLALRDAITDQVMSTYQPVDARIVQRALSRVYAQTHRLCPSSNRAVPVAIPTRGRVTPTTADQFEDPAWRCMDLQLDQMSWQVTVTTDEGNQSVNILARAWVHQVVVAWGIRGRVKQGLLEFDEADLLGPRPLTRAHWRLGIRGNLPAMSRPWNNPAATVDAEPQQKL